MEQIMVSIICNTYNHEKYIADALEGFVSQKTNFKFEVLIHDDASTDGTADIIRKYEKKYPEIIKPIYQTENQYSKGIKISFALQFPRAKGKYIAMCEGDDYWIDEYKLQKQVDYMETHPDCTFCFTNGKILMPDRMVESFVPYPFRDSEKKDGQVDFDVPALEMLGFIPTASFFFKNGLNVPEISPEAFSGDAYIKLVMTNYGYAHFIDEPMVVYRKTDENSATGQWDRDKVKFAQVCDKFVHFYYAMKEITGHKYDDLFNYRIFQRTVLKVMALKDCCNMNDELSKKWNFLWFPLTIGLRLVRKYYKIKYRIKAFLRHCFNKGTPNRV